MNYKIRAKFKTNNVREFAMDYNGDSYLIIYGQHINGGFIAVPGYGKSCEAGEPCDVFHNRDKLEGCGFDKDTAKAIACAIRDFRKEASK